MAILFDSIIWDTVTILTTIICVTIAYFNYCFKYWEKRGVPFIQPSFPTGNGLTNLLHRGIDIGINTHHLYKELKARGHDFGGVYAVVRPLLMLVNPDYVKDILSRDFSSFVDRGIYYDEIHDPISANMFSFEGSKWKTSRVKLTPIFTSGKMKTMFNSVTECCNNMMGKLEQYSKNVEDIDIFETAGCYTTDVIGSIAFGVNCNSFSEPNAEFRRMGKRIFEIDFVMAIRYFILVNLPKLASKLGLIMTNKDVSQFFTNMVQHTIGYREANNVKRTDFLQILTELKNSSDEKERISMEEIVAQSFLFFTAGFETSSSTMTFALFELGRNEELQDKLRDEINSVLEANGGDFTYENIKEMKYLGQILDETLRMYPPVTTLSRVCTKDYKLNNTDVVIEAGTKVLISVYGLQRDPDYFPNPDKFDIEHFSEENKRKRHPYAYLPFGEGPRNCVGLRFGLMQTKIGIANIIRKYKVSVSKNTVLPIKIRDDTFLLNTVNKILINLNKID